MFESNAAVVVNAEKEIRIEVPLDNLREVTFSLPPPAIVSETRVGIAGELPEPWQSDDVGSVRLPGRARFASGRFHVKAAGTNLWGDSDSFHFVFQTVQDTTEIVARVTQLQLTDPWARAGVMMRESLAAGSRHVFLGVTAARGGVLQWRDRLGEETGVRLERGIFVPCWLKLKREADVFTALSSPNGKQWRVVEKIHLNAARELYVGLGVVGVREQTHSVFEQVEQGPSLRNRWFVPQVELQSGSTQVGYIDRMDDTAVHFDVASGKAALSEVNIANVRFRPVPARLTGMLNANRTGVLLNTGEFIEGECRGIQAGRVIISSVPLGLCRFDCNDEVVALVLRRRSPAVPFAYEVKTADGSVWRGQEVMLDRSGVLIREPSLGLRRVALHEVFELRRRL